MLKYKISQADLMIDNNVLTNYIDSISCLHALEHFGLGRYGDTVCFNGHLIGFKNITKMLQQGGKFYFSVLFGRKQRIEFHAPRVFSLEYLLSIVSPHYHIDCFSYVGDLYLNIHTPLEDLSKKLNLNMGCAIFELTKK
jgi:cyclopropane fatty-acyl-phospholipid synthase-like methyltransferase